MARPEFQPTKAMRQRVATAAGAGMSHEEIAIGLGISRNTLKKHFAEELTAGAYQKRLEVVNALHKAAKKGNVAAAREYLKMDPRVAAPPDKPVAEGEGEANVPPVGKKAAANAAARTAGEGTEWGDLLGQKPPGTPLQ